MTQPYLSTPEGENKLKAELAELTGPRREELAKRLRSAIQMGDLSENADYHKAKEDQAFLEGRIQEIEAILRIAVIIEKTTQRRGHRRLARHRSGGGFRPRDLFTWSAPRRPIRATARSPTNPPSAAR